jgi:hypothetical protein
VNYSKLFNQIIDSPLQMFRKRRPNWIIKFSYQTSLHSVLLKFNSSQRDLPCITRSSAMQTNIVKQSDFQFALNNISPYRHERWRVAIRLVSRWVQEWASFRGNLEFYIGESFTSQIHAGTLNSARHFAFHRVHWTADTTN